MTEASFPQKKESGSTLQNIPKETKHTTELTAVKSYEKGLVFFVAKTVNDITNKLAKGFSQ